MPGILTHYLCGDTVFRKLENTELGDLLHKYRQVFNLGTQGPDILFYYGAWPWAKSEGINTIGENMHDRGSGAFFKSSLQYAKSLTIQEKELLAAYLCGFACHYSLDLHAHPYIFFKTGFIREGEEATKKFGYYHRSFETTLDVLMLARLMNATPGKLDVASLIEVSAEEALVIGKMYESVLQNALAIRISSLQVQRAIADMVGITKALHNKTGLKKKLFTLLERPLSPYPLVSSMIHPISVTDGLDYLNLERKEWQLPWDDSVTFNSSFIELFEEATDEAQVLCNAIFNCLFAGTEIAEAALLLGNRSFSTGIDCDTDTVFKYYDLIYE